MLSGTSVDGLDVAVADLDVDAAGTLTLRPLQATTVAWPVDLRRRVLAVLPPAPTTADEVCRLDTEIGQFAGAAAAKAAAEHRADLVVSLGQTVFHWVDTDGHARGTLQLGQPAWIVEATGAPVTSPPAATARRWPRRSMRSGYGDRHRELRSTSAASRTSPSSATSTATSWPSTPARPTACSTSSPRGRVGERRATTSTARWRPRWSNSPPAPSPTPARPTA